MKVKQTTLNRIFAGVFMILALVSLGQAYFQSIHFLTPKFVILDYVPFSYGLTGLCASTSVTLIVFIFLWLGIAENLKTANAVRWAIRIMPSIGILSLMLVATQILHIEWTLPPAIGAVAVSIAFVVFAHYRRKQMRFS